MTMKRLMIGCFLSVSMIATPAFAQVKIGDTGVKVKTGDTEVTAGENGTTTKTGDTEVETGEDGTRVRTKKKVKKKVKRKHVRKTKRKLKARGAVVCKGTNDITLDGQEITGKVGVEVRGACNITIKNSVIKTKKLGALIQGSGDITLINTVVQSRGAGLKIQGSGDITLVDSEVVGKPALVIQGSGDISAKGTTINKGIKITGTGEFEDKGGNTIEK